MNPRTSFSTGPPVVAPGERNVLDQALRGLARGFQPPLYQLFQALVPVPQIAQFGEDDFFPRPFPPIFDEVQTWHHSRVWCIRALFN